MPSTFLAHVCERFIARLPAHPVLFHVMRAWGHLFPYDEPVLVDALTRCGFDPVTCCSYGRSECSERTGMERHHVGPHPAKGDACGSRR